MVKRVIKLIIWNIISLYFIQSAQASLLSPQMNNHFASTEQAFAFSSVQKDNNIILEWRMLDGYYLYKDKIELEVNGASLGRYQLPKGKIYHDELLGDVEVFTHQLKLNVPLITAEAQATLKVYYQGCTDGLCYPPVIKTIKLNSTIMPSAIDKTKSTIASIVNDVSIPLSPNNASTINTLSFSFLWAIVLGIGIAFTPCVLPMYPLITSIILGQQHRFSVRRTLGLAISYVQGMAITYTLLGVVVAAAGLQFQAILQHPYILISLSILFVALAFSMFGLYDLQLPSSLQTRFSQWSNNQQQSKLLGVFLMGAIAGLICSPCTTAPLAAILLYIAQSSNLYTGAITLYCYAIGMGLPLIAITVFGNNLLPQRGPWMIYVKHAFGFVILAMPLFLLERVIEDSWIQRLWSILGTSFFSWGLLTCLTLSTRKSRFVAIMCLIGAIVCARPLQDWLFIPTNNAIITPTLNTKSIHSLDELKTVLRQSQGKTVLLDFYADWCVACKALDKYTFTDPRVQVLLKDTLLLRVDVTANTIQHQELFTHYQIVGLPALLWFDKQGKEQSTLRINGFLAADDFIKYVDNFLTGN